MWQLLALSDAEFEAVDLVEVNLAVARGIPSLKDLDVPRYCDIVGEWTAAFRKFLPGAERQFQQTPHKWKNDVHFFRVGMLAGFLGHDIGIRYVEDHKQAGAVYYTNPGELFLNGLIDTKQGSCGNMAALHVAMARQMGWPVSLACVKAHYISRFDNGKVIHNIEATNTDHPGTFASNSDDWYMSKMGIPQKAVDCGSDLRSLSMREMIGAFLSLRGRHFTDVNDPERADESFALARALFRNHRRAYIGAMIPLLRHGERLFDNNEVGHPNSFFNDLAPMFIDTASKATIPEMGVGLLCTPLATRTTPTPEYISGLPMPRVFSKTQVEGK